MQDINNAGQEYPMQPSVFQCWRKETGSPSTSAWIITSKDKLEVLSDCSNSLWKGQYRPSYNCGISGKGTGNREDTATWNTAKKILEQYHPKLVMLHFKEPDISGHNGNWQGYLDGIRSSDSLLYELWKFLQQDSIYSGKTTLFVSNDHGRHLDPVKDGYVSHGDSCEGCRHINCFAAGPDFKKNVLLDSKHCQQDIPATIATMMGFQLPVSEGKAMEELFIDLK